MTQADIRTERSGAGHLALPSEARSPVMELTGECNVFPLQP